MKLIHSNLIQYTSLIYFLGSVYRMPELTTLSFQFLSPLHTKSTFLEVNEVSDIQFIFSKEKKELFFFLLSKNALKSTTLFYFYYDYFFYFSRFTYLYHNHYINDIILLSLYKDIQLYLFSNIFFNF